MSDWIAERLNREAARDSIESAQVAREQRDALLVDTLSAQFLSDTVREMRLQLDAISALKMQGVLSAVASPTIGPQIYSLRICQTWPSFREEIASFHFGVPFDGPALFRLNDGTGTNIHLVALPDGKRIAALWPSERGSLDPQSLAAVIVKSMVDRVKPERL